MPTQSLHNEMEEKGTRKAFYSESIKHWDTFLPFYTVYMKKKPLHVCTMINGFLLAIFVSPMSS